MTRARKILLQNRCPRLRLKATEVRRLFHVLDGSGLFPAPPGEISVVIVDDEEIARMHGQFLDDPSPTDVITFTGEPEMDFGGEIFVSAERARAFSHRRALDFSRELTLYLVHGYLHLAGFDDLTPEKKRAMRRAEKKALSVLEKTAALPEFILIDRSS